MFYGAGPVEFAKAKSLRENQTESEKVLWERLSNKQLSVKFRRQHPVSQYIVDFYCHEKKLVVEIDGLYHQRPDQQKYDELRTKDLNLFGLRVIRFSDEQVFEHINEVVEEIQEALKTKD